MLIHSYPRHFAHWSSILLNPSGGGSKGIRALVKDGSPKSYISPSSSSKASERKLHWAKQSSAILEGFNNVEYWLLQTGEEDLELAMAIAVAVQFVETGAANSLDWLIRVDASACSASLQSPSVRNSAVSLGAVVPKYCCRDGMKCVEEKKNEKNH